jgi:hypothetical protein
VKSPWAQNRELEKELEEERRRRQATERLNAELASDLASSRQAVKFLKQEIEPVLRGVSQIERTLAGQPWQ